MQKTAVRCNGNADDGAVGDLDVWTNFKRADHSDPAPNGYAMTDVDATIDFCIRPDSNIDAGRDFGTDLGILPDDCIVGDDDGRGMDLGSRVNKLG